MIMANKKSEEYAQLITEHAEFVKEEPDPYEAFLKYKNLFYKGEAPRLRLNIYRDLMQFYNKMSIASDMFYDDGGEAESLDEYIVRVNESLYAERRELLAKLGYNENEARIFELWSNPPQLRW